MFNREKPQYIEDSKFRYTLREMKKNASVYVLLAPYFLLFTIFTIIPVLLSLPMGFTNFNMVQFPQFVGLSNFYSLILEDEVFLKAIQNTLVFAIITGPLSYIMCFILAWLINEMPRALKTIFTFIFYAPTLAGNIYTTWQLIFSGDTYGIANSYLLDLGIINSARQWLTDANYIMGVVIVVQLWMCASCRSSGYTEGQIRGGCYRRHQEPYTAVTACYGAGNGPSAAVRSGYADHRFLHSR